jgi:hypothetical protein
MPKKKEWPPKTLADLVSIGKAMLKDFELLGIKTIEQLASQDAKELYDRLSKLTHTYQDPCVLDTFQCAIQQAKNPKLSPEKRQWYYWSRLRKKGCSSN